MELVDALVKEGQALYTEDAPGLPGALRSAGQKKLPSIVFDRHLYEPLLAHGFYRSDDTVVGHFEEMPEIVSVPTGLNHGEARFVVQLREALAGPAGARLGNRQVYLLRNLSRSRGISFFESDSAANSFYPDFILWVVSGRAQKIIFIDPKGLRNLSPRDFNNYKIRLFRELPTAMQDIALPAGWEIKLDSYIISDKSYNEVRRYFGDPSQPYPREEFTKNHILFPDGAVEDLLKAVLA